MKNKSDIIWEISKRKHGCGITGEKTEHVTKLKLLEAVVRLAGREPTQQPTSDSDLRMIFKIRSTNNDEYQVRSDFGLGDPAEKLSTEVTRLSAPPPLQMTTELWCNLQTH
ncbi:hypothetical protein COOONC_17552 [Cooperia oncophora]